MGQTALMSQEPRQAGGQAIAGVWAVQFLVTDPVLRTEQRADNDIGDCGTVVEDRFEEGNRLCTDRTEG